EERVAEILRPVELLVHHSPPPREGAEGFHAVVPGLLLERLVELVALEIRVGLGEAGGLDDLEGIGRGHEDLRDQRGRIERDGSDELIEILWSPLRFALPLAKRAAWTLSRG